MASISKRPDGLYHLSFRLGGKQFKPSLKTRNEKRAQRIKAIAEETVQLLDQGRLTLPGDASNADIIQFVLSGGRTTEKPKLRATITLERVVEEYFASYVAGKEPATVQGEKIHVGHFKRLLGLKTSFASITTDTLQGYAAKRAKEGGINGGTVQGETIKKEFRTFCQIWKMAVAKGYVSGLSPTKGVKIELPDEKHPFMTWAEIAAIVNRGGLTDEQQKSYWDRLFLDEVQVLEFLADVQQAAEHPFVYAAVAFAAFTGARRSEIIRSQIEDWDFERAIVRIREKKGSHKKKTTFREIDIHPRLAKIMKDWLKTHPGGPFVIALPAVMARSRNKHDFPTPLTPHQAHDYFSRAVAGSKWKVLKGWHVLRHSFCSNCARRGVPDAIIDAWMGHRGNEDIKKRYRHLFPSDRKAYMTSLFPSPGLKSDSAC